jgi:hypothetical protein
MLMYCQAECINYTDTLSNNKYSNYNFSFTYFYSHLGSKGTVLLLLFVEGEAGGRFFCFLHIQWHNPQYELAKKLRNK